MVGKHSTKVREHRGQDFCRSSMEEFEIDFATKVLPKEHMFVFLQQILFRCMKVLIGTDKNMDIERESYPRGSSKHSSGPCDST